MVYMRRGGATSCLLGPVVKRRQDASPLKGEKMVNNPREELNPLSNKLSSSLSEEEEEERRVKIEDCSSSLFIYTLDITTHIRSQKRDLSLWGLVLVHLPLQFTWIRDYTFCSALNVISQRTPRPSGGLGLSFWDLLTLWGAGAYCWSGQWTVVVDATIFPWPKLVQLRAAASSD